MEIVKELFRKKYLEGLRNNPELFIGIELEYPIVHLQNEATDCRVARALMLELIEQGEFKAVKFDDEGCPIALSHANGDSILFEVSYNTLEFAFCKSKTIQEVETRLEEYLGIIQPFLRRNNHELQGKGINPNWAINDNRPVKTSRYQMLSNFLRLSQDYDQCHDVPEYGAFICGNQVQFDVARKDVLRVLNAFNKIEAVKAYLFANSELEELLPGHTITRDFFWEKSMHGVFSENIGLYHQEFRTEDDYLTYMTQTAMFSVARKEDYHYFKPVRAADYFTLSDLKLCDSSENLQPNINDIAFHRSYHYQELTARGTVEFRSICTQNWDKTFAPIAFQLGLLVNLERFESVLAETTFFEEVGRDYDFLRKNYSKKNVSQEDIQRIRAFSAQLINCAYEGLVSRSKGEEKYLHRLL